MFVTSCGMLTVMGAKNSKKRFLIMVTLHDYHHARKCMTETVLNVEVTIRHVHAFVVKNEFFKYVRYVGTSCGVDS